MDLFKEVLSQKVLQLNRKIKLEQSLLQKTNRYFVAAVMQKKWRKKYHLERGINMVYTRNVYKFGLFSTLAVWVQITRKTEFYILIIFYGKK